MKDKYPYSFFPNYILRTPIFSLDYYKSVTSKKEVSETEIRNLCNNPVFREAIFLSSPDLYFQVEKWLNGDLRENKDSWRLKLTILKYFSRMCARCTPFGIYSGCSLGSFKNKTDVRVKESIKNTRHTRLDMNYLVALSINLLKNTDIRENILFFPNSSLYSIGERMRYVEYYYVNSKRYHDISSVENTEYLKTILGSCNKGATLEQIALSIVNDEICFDEAKEFIDELIENQILISELEPSVLGPEFLDQICSVLKKIPSVSSIYSLLTDTQRKIKELDSTIGNSPDEYLAIAKKLEKLETEFELKFLFQVDLVLSHEKNTLSDQFLKKLQRGMLLLNKLTPTQQDSPLTEFSNRLFQRYENQEIKLSQVLDIESGIAYKQNAVLKDINPLIQDLKFPFDNMQKAKSIEWNPINKLIFSKLNQAFQHNQRTIKIEEDDLIEFDSNWNDLPDTMSSIIEIINNEGGNKIKLSSFNGSSAANLLGRFCHGDDRIYEYVKNITTYEKEKSSNKLLAEIVHLPEARVGNILMRPELRDYEIPYLAKSNKSNEYKIGIDDLMVSADGRGRIFLRSKRLNKEVVPRLTNAHNYSSNALPVYHFLCDLQAQGLRSGIRFSYGPLGQEYSFLPRVEYDNLILHEATWIVNQKEIKVLKDTLNQNDDFEKAVKNFKTSLELPQYVTLMDGDNKLLINLDNLTMVKMLISLVKKRPRFTLVEFLFSDNENATVKGKEGENYTNEFIVSVYNNTLQPIIN